MRAVEDAWNELRRRGVPGTLLRLDERNSADLYAAVGDGGRPGLIAISHQDIPSIEPLAAVETISRQLNTESQLEIWLNDLELEALFATLCNDLVSHSFGPTGRVSAPALITRLESWRRMLELGKGRLDQAALRGLVGELLVLEHLAGLMPLQNIVHGWNGGFSASHDFAFEEFHLEVKAVGPNANSVSITSLDQLDVHLQIMLFLGIAFVFEADDELVRGFTLSSLVNRICNQVKLSAVEPEFLTKLRSRGIMSPENYEGVWYRLDSLRYFKVGPQFPKLTRSGVVPGIQSATYSIALSAIESFEHSLEREL